MSYNLTVQDLPVEMLENILLQLSLKDRLSALRVCKRWSELKLFDLSSVQLRVDAERFNDKNYLDCYRALLASSRQYKHIKFYFGRYFEKYDLMLDILRHFSQSVESLKLTNFLLDVGLNFEFAPYRGDLKMSPMNNVKELFLWDSMMLTSIPNIQDIMPNITRLQIDIRGQGRDSLNFLQHFSPQLIELEALIHTNNDFLKVCQMQFPIMEKATLTCSFGYPHGITLLCQSLRHIQFLYLSLRFLNAFSLHAICNLKHLKTLHLGAYDVNIPRELNFPPLKSLRVLSLQSMCILEVYEFQNFCQYAFPNLAVLEMKDMEDMQANRDMSFELYDNLCNNMSSMKRLLISQPNGNLQLSPFLSFCATAPRDLRIQCKYVSDTYPWDEFPPIQVETLMMDVSQTSLELLQKLIKSMGQLKRLELRSLFFDMYPETIQCLRHDFPQCEINHKGLTTLIDFSSSIFSFINNSAAKTFQALFDDVEDRLEHPLSILVANSVWNAFAASLLTKEKNDEEKSINVVRPL